MAQLLKQGRRRRIAAVAGLGLIRTTELIIADELASGQLVQVLPSAIDNSSTGIYALYVSGRHILPRQRVFLDHMADWFRAQRRGAGEGPLAVSAPVLSARSA